MEIVGEDNPQIAQIGADGIRLGREAGLGRTCQARVGAEIGSRSCKKVFDYAEHAITTIFTLRATPQQAGLFFE